jgi:hypothetical protein
MEKALWYSNFPEPKSKPRITSDENLSAMMRDPQKRAGKDYIVVDVRRTDFEVFPTLTPPS